MNIIYYFFVLFIVYWTDAAFIHSISHLSSKWSLDRRRPTLSIAEDFQNEIATSEPVLSRRRPQLKLAGRRRRWSVDDEVEIPVESISTLSTITDNKQPLLRQDTIEINDTTVSNNDTLIESITEFVVPISISENLTETNQSISEILTTTEITDAESSTATSMTSQDTAIVLLDFTTVQPVTNNEYQTSTDSIVDITSPYEPTTVEYNATATSEQIENSTQVSAESDNSTVVLETTESIEIMTTTFDVVQNSTDFIENMSTTFDVVQNSTDFIENMTSLSEVIDLKTDILDGAVQNDTETIDVTTIVLDNTTQEVEYSIVLSETTTETSYEDNEYANETIAAEPKVPPKPVCDEACQCIRKCPYGYETVNGTCQCDPPCKNSQCFGNDTCVVSKSGQPECRPTNGSVHDRPSRCYQPRDSGYHDADIRYHNRWYYNVDQDACHLFVFRGLGGNRNNFQSLHECTLECITCGPAPDRGSCLGFMRMWHYNHTTNQCSQFEYSGCKGNENKFIRKTDCTDTCVTRILNL